MTALTRVGIASRSTCFGVGLGVLLAAVSSASAQHAGGFSTGVRLASTQVLSTSSGHSQEASRGSLGLEALGGSVGSAAGIGLVLLVSECGVDDLACEIVTVGVAGAAGVLGATLGTALAARQTGSRHSAAGAALGAILGTGVGLGVHYLLNRNSDRNLGDLVVVPIFAISQGVFAAIGGRW